VPVEATWCGELQPAAPDVGMKCRPDTIFGRLPIRFDQSSLDQTGGVFTDIMSIPPSVSRRAYQAAARGESSAFFYVRRFASNSGGPDEYVFVTCRMTGGGARTPLALLDVQLAFGGDSEVLALAAGATAPPLRAEIVYNGTGRLDGRWEVVLPGEELPSADDLLPEASLPPDRRALQRRYTELERFSVFLPPTGRVTLPGPDPRRIPTGTDGLYQILLRIEATNDKEGDSNLALAGAGAGVVHSGAVAGFPLPTLRYTVGGDTAGRRATQADGLQLIAPAPGASLDPLDPAALDFAWTITPEALLYRLEIEDSNGQLLHGAVVQQGIARHRAPAWLAQSLPQDGARWRVVALGASGEAIRTSERRTFTVAVEVTPPQP
jgi:hypothetical protein